MPNRYDLRVKHYFITVIFSFFFVPLLACSETATDYISGETIIVADEASEEVTEEIEPIIDWSDIPEGQSDGTDVSTSTSSDVTTTDDSNVCDDTVDADGDGIFCDCDTNDNSARTYSVYDDCDNDGDGIPNEYDLCPYRSDNDVTTVLLCDDNEKYDGIESLVDYDDDKWSCSDIIAGTVVTEFNPAVSNTATKANLSVNFPISYIFTDEDEDGKADNCEMIVRGDFNELQPNSFQN